MELNGLELDKKGVKTQRTPTRKQPEDKPKQLKSSTRKKKQQTPKTVPKNTLQDYQCKHRTQSERLHRNGKTAQCRTKKILMLSNVRTNLLLRCKYETPPLRSGC